MRAAPEKPLADRDRNVVRVERGFYRKEPLPLFVLLADHGRLVRRAVELLAHLGFDQRALFFHDDDEIEPLREFLELSGDERPRASNLEKANAEIVRALLVDAELVES